MKKSRKRFCYILIILLCIYSTIICWAEPFDIDAKAAILIDASTGEILYEKNIHEELPPASITKIMTMLLTMEALDTNQISLDDEVIISERAASMGGTQLYVEPGEVKTVEDLIKGITIRSANDASVAIAEHIAGTEELFVEKMNTRAKELGMNNTHFMNSNGLPAEGHLMSTYDIAIMSRELLKFPEIQKWLTTWIDIVEVGKNTKSTQELVNTNKLVRSYEGITGIKTGSTSEAKYCLSASATRGNNSFIAVVMAAPTSTVRFSEATKLLDYAFNNFDTIKVVEKGANMGSILVEKGEKSKLNITIDEDLNILVKKGEKSNVDKEINIPSSVKAPIVKGEKIGEIIINLDGQQKKKVELISAETIKKASVVNILERMFKDMVGIEK
ncbi:MAG: D-alanyl-D-alanine carboxypeptidase [Clostridiales bacterium]|nr:D-alanyl-D-alanine carboxypeptidase [Clostridiales bacterium]